MAYQTLLTPIGLAKQAAFLSGGDPIQIAQIALGDQNGTEVEFSEGQEGLIHEVHRASVSAVITDPTNPLRTIAQLALPPSVGGFWIREAATIDADGDVISVTNIPPRFKATAASGGGGILLLGLGIVATNAGVVVEATIDGSEVYATRDFLQSELEDLPESWADADKLGGQLPAHYATQAALTSVANAGTSTQTDLDSLELLVTAIASVPTGIEFGYWGATAPAGYVLASGRTIGNTSSGATERADADTFNLYSLLWSSGTNATLPIQTSAGSASTRGASAFADFAANKRMSLPDLRGRVGVGRDDMGGTAASRMTTGVSGVNGASLGSSGGAEAHTLTVAQLPSHSHGGATGNQSANHTHTQQGTFTSGGQSATHTHPIGAGTTLQGSSTGTFEKLSSLSENGTGSETGVTGVGSADHTHNVTISGQTGGDSANHTHTVTAEGGGGAHPNVQPSIVRNVIIKL